MRLTVHFAAPPGSSSLRAGVRSHHGQLQDPEVGDLGVSEEGTVAMSSFSSQLTMQYFSSTA